MCCSVVQKQTTKPRTSLRSFQTSGLTLLSIPPTSLLHCATMNQSSQETDSSFLSTTPSDYPGFLETLQTVRARVAAYVPQANNDYTAALLQALLDNQKVIGLCGFKNILDDITNAPDLALLAQHYLSAIFTPRTMTYTCTSSIELLTQNSQSQRRHAFSTAYPSAWWI
jgi:hypothetical protein